MASLPAKLILSLLLLLGIAAAPLKAQTLQKPKPKKEFDYFTLSLSWTGTRCMNVKECCPANGCCNPDIGSEFTIRAFWPDYNDGTWPACCNGTTFNENEISPLKRHLERYWPSYYCTLSSACGSPKGSHWAYEWVKHGTCASPVLPSQYDYFSTVLLLYATVDVTGTLSRAGYVASDTAEYPLEGITSAIKNAYYKATPVVSCYGNAVKEIQICFDKTLMPQECPTTESGMLSKSSSDECPSIVTLPIKNVTPVPGKMNHLSFRGVLNW